MRFVLMFICCLGLLVLSLSRASALEVKASQEEFSSIIEQLVESRIQPILQYLPAHEQQILSKVEITVVDELPFGGMALAVDDDQPIILISNQFIRGLSAYVDAYKLALSKQQPYLIEQYFSEYFWKHHPTFIGEQPKSPFQWANVSLARQEQLKQESTELLEGVLIDVLLHELGHHAKDAFYSYRASQYVIDDNERLADDWARAVSDQWIKPAGGLGRLLSIAFIFEQDRWATLMKDNHYYRMLPGVVGQLQDLCEDTEFVDKQRFCAQLYENITRYFSKEVMVVYQERLERGEAFASFPIAQIHLAKNNFVDACNYFNESLIYGQVARAAIYVGWCYQNGYLDQSPPDAQVLAMSGSSYGFSDRHLVVAMVIPSDS